MKSLETPPPRKDPILNQDINTLGIEKDLSLPPHLRKFHPGYKSLINEADDACNVSTDTSCTDKDDSIKNIKAMNKIIVMMNTNKKIRNIKTVMKVLSTKPNNNKHRLNG